MLHAYVPDDRLNLARHELGHAFMAHSCGFYVHRIELDAAEDRTTTEYGLQPDEFAVRYEQSPYSAALAVARIVACGRAGAYVKLVGGMTGGEPRGRDLERIGLWREAVLPI